MAIFIAEQADIANEPVKAAPAAWRRFVASMELLPPDQAAPLWQAAHERASAAISNLSSASALG
jgi:hypothetical protein